MLLLLVFTLIRQLLNSVIDKLRGLRFVRSVIRRSAVIRSILKNTGIMSQVRLDAIGTGGIPIPPIRGYPKSATFQGPFPSHDLVVLLGTTRMDPAVQHMIVNFVGWSAAGREVVREIKCSFVPVTTEPPYIVRRRLPECIVWSEHVLVGIDEACETLQARFHPSQVEGLRDVTAADLRCYCLLAGRYSSGDEVRWIVDMASGVPVKTKAVEDAEHG